MDRFTSFEGDTGPYILYTMVRIKSILDRYEAQGGKVSDTALGEAEGEDEIALSLQLTGFAKMAREAFEELAPHKVCAYVYDLANALNRFYHSTRILAETDENRQKRYIALLALTERVFETGIELLGFECPDRM